MEPMVERNSVERDSTERLVERAKSGDRDAFDRLVERFRGRLRSSLESWSRFQLGPKLDAEDTLQETFVRAHRALSRFEWEGDDAFFRWLCGIAKRALAHLAADARRVKRPPTDSGEPAALATPSRMLRREERFERLEAAIERLTPEYREVLLLSRIEGLTAVEIAARMNRSPNAVRHLIVRALRELRAHFGDTESLHLPDRRLAAGDRDDD
jgi:RNA polymerase sigma-70 factor (ECF subfamily)